MKDIKNSLKFLNKDGKDNYFFYDCLPKTMDIHPKKSELKNSDWN